VFGVGFVGECESDDFLRGEACTSDVVLFTIYIVNEIVEVGICKQELELRNIAPVRCEGMVNTNSTS